MDKQSPDAKILHRIAEAKENPFHTMEAISEHIGVLWGWFHKNGYEIPQIEHGRRKAKGTVGDYDHEILVIERYLQDLLNAFSALLPELYLASNGDMEALARIKPELLKLAERQQKRWELYDQG